MKQKDLNPRGLSPFTFNMIYLDTGRKNQSKLPAIAPTTKQPKPQAGAAYHG